MSLGSRLLKITVAASLLTGGIVVESPVSQAAVQTILATKSYRNCAALTQVYPHGVGSATGKDLTKGKAKRNPANFTRNDEVYKQNRHLDADKDGVACER